MIRLSCWIGGVGCVPVDKTLVEDVDRTLSPVMQTTPVKRCIDADIDGSGGLGLRRFENVASRLAKHFHASDMEGNDESSVDEIREAWRKCKTKLMARGGPDCPGPAGKDTKESRAPCLADAD